MRVQPTMRRGDAPKRLETAARVQVVVGEAAADQCRNFDALQIGGAGGPPRFPQRTLALRRAEVGSAPPLAADSGAPQAEEPHLADAAGVGEVAVDIAEALPPADGGE